jgi:glycosyltransferase involved in cell wall biosynthesis
MKYEASIVIPVYNEIKSLDTLCYKLKDTFKDFNIKYIFIDDGSSDGSKNWLKNNLDIIFRKKEFELIILEKNYGKGYAVKKGIKNSEGKYTLFLDSDLEYEPQDLFEMYNVILANNEIKVLYGSRNLGSKTQLRRYFINGIAVKINTWIFNFLFNQSLSDLHTGSKIIYSSLLSDLNINTNGFGLEVVMSSEIAKKKINIYEYGISYYERTVEQGKKITLFDGIKSYLYLFRERFLKNDLPTQISILYSLIFMTYAGTYFGMGVGKILAILFFMITGLVIALNRKIVPLSIVFFLMYIGSLFSKGNGKIYTIIICFIAGLYLSKKIKTYFINIKQNFITRLLI